IFIERGNRHSGFGGDIPDPRARNAVAREDAQRRAQDFLLPALAPVLLPFAPVGIPSPDDVGKKRFPLRLFTGGGPVFRSLLQHGVQLDPVFVSSANRGFRQIRKLDKICILYVNNTYLSES